MPPEQALGRVVDQRADIYALGLIIYDMLAGPARFAGFANIKAELKERCRAAPQPRCASAHRQCRCSRRARRRCAQTRSCATVPERRPSSRKRSRAWTRTACLYPFKRTVGLPQCSRRRPSRSWPSAARGGTSGRRRRRRARSGHGGDRRFRQCHGDATFDQTLEPILKLSIETASFVTAFARSDVPRVLGVRAPDAFDAQAATELAVKQGLGVVLAGAIEPDGRRVQAHADVDAADHGQRAEPRGGRRRR